ncbi:MAG: acetyl esterase [Tenericutes bacterium ADurb.BinA155]|nr:MAG: acetyl esterase [Tenericutes bacterium ADurb.BinA155]
MRINKFMTDLLVLWMTKDNRKRRKKVKPMTGPGFWYDIPYKGDQDDQHRFDLMLADPSKRLHRLFIDIHGGGYLFGNRKNNYTYAMFFREAGYDVCVADYDLVKDNITVEDQIHDVAAMLRYLHQHAQEFDVANDPWFISGDSAGGHLALILAEASCNPLTAARLDIDLTGVRFNAVLVNCTVFDYANCVGKAECTKVALRQVYGVHGSDPKWCELYSPKTYVGDLKIPLFYSSAKLDPLLPESQKLDAALKGSTLPHQFCYIDSDDKRASHVHNVSYPNLPASKKVNSAMLTFMDQNAK